jgi:hypothetical protein
MFGIFKKAQASKKQDQVDQILEGLKLATQKSWATYKRLYLELSPSEKVLMADKLDNAVALVEKEVSFDFMKEKPFASLEKLNKMQSVFTSIRSGDRLQSLAGQMVITYLYAQFCWSPEERQDVSHVMRQASLVKG